MYKNCRLDRGQTNNKGEPFYIKMLMPFDGCNSESARIGGKSQLPVPNQEFSGPANLMASFTLLTYPFCHGNENLDI